MPQLARALVVAVLIASGGCAIPALTALDHNSRFGSTSADAIVVFGFSSRWSAWIYPGTDDGVSWHCRGGLVNVRRVQPEEGFVVVRLPASTGKHKYGIGQFGASMNVEVQRVPVDTGVWIFDAVPGQVTYLGAFRVVGSDGGPRIVEDASRTVSDADDFMTRTFPNIRDHVATGRMESAYMANDCQSR